MAIHSTCRQSSTVNNSSTPQALPCPSSSSCVAEVASELEKLRRYSARHHQTEVQFPPACRSLLFSLEGNHHCADCQAPRPEWASISYGILLCVQCCGRHRSYGVQHSRVKSVEMDAWDHKSILSMLEGGNAQLGQFFDRHRMTNRMMCRRYKTKAALFYRTHLQKHVQHVAQAGVYQGREEARKKSSAVVVSSNPQSPPSPSTSPSPEEQESMERTAVQARGIAAN